ncbi:MAG: NAD(P)H-dependent oxidoreductase, partial [Cyanobacteria bacterium]|nr:NAD(P)H-dependent oxidoreductase [Cyanobacteriota bacterium]
KQYFDLIFQSDWMFKVSENGAIQGLVTNKPLVLILARGGNYTPGSGKEGFDFQAPYLFRAMEFVGFSDIRPIYIQPTGMGPDTLSNALEKAKAEANQMALQLPGAESVLLNSV